MPDKNTNKRILLVEDDPFLMKIMGNMLERAGFLVDRAKDGVEALASILKNDYKLVLLDLLMPIKTGFEVLKELKDQQNKTPVLVFTNLSQKEDREEVMSLGARSFFVKSDISIDDVVRLTLEYAGS